MHHHIFHIDCLQLGRDPRWMSMFDAIVTDPPYGLGFMGAAWDFEVPGPQYWKAILATAKPGAHLVAFAGTRKEHRLTCAIEDAGWEIRDRFAWLYGEGYPKNAKTQLKPGHEPIVLARKPLELPLTENVAKYGTGTLNIDACRIEVLDQKGGRSYAGGSTREVGREHSGGIGFRPAAGDPNDGKGRWPANVILDAEAATLLDAQSGTRKSGTVTKTYTNELQRSVALGVKRRTLDPSKVFADEGGASRFFYCSKASKSERTHGGAVQNDHATVKPLGVMRWLLRLVTPPGGLVYDPFCGSGATLVAAKLEGFSGIGSDRDEKSVRISRARLAEVL